MRAITVEPGVRDSARLETLDEPAPTAGWLRVKMLAIGVCGTDTEILSGRFGKAPPGKNRLVLGHESLGEVVEAPADSGFRPGDRVVGIVRRPDPEPCLACAADEWDMCRNGRYTERGIDQLDGYAAEIVTLEPRFAVPVDRRLGLTAVLTEPASVVAKAWEQVDRIGARSRWQPRRVLVVGAGPIGLLAAMMGTQRGLDVRVLDRMTDGPKPVLVRALGAHYHTDDVAHAGAGADIVIECTGVAQLVLDAMNVVSPAGVVCLAGLSPGGALVDVDMGALNHKMVLGNNVVAGSVNANRRHYESAVHTLAKADPVWLHSLITRQVPLDRWPEALQRQPTDVKPVITFASI